MSIETTLAALLRNNPGLQALVGTRIAADRVEAKTPLPYVVFTRTGTESFVTLDNTLLGERAFVELQCWAESRGDADAVAAACEAAIRGAGQQITNRAGATDTELDLQSTTLTVEWFATT